MHELCQSSDCPVTKTPLDDLKRLLQIVYGQMLNSDGYRGWGKASSLQVESAENLTKLQRIVA